MAQRQKNVHWIKWHTKETIYGSFMTENVDSLGFMVKMCCLSAETRYPGYIQAEPDVGIPAVQVAALLSIPLDLYLQLLGQQKELGRIVEDGTGVLDIVNWGKYQAIPKWDGKGEPLSEKPEARSGQGDGRPAQRYIEERRQDDSKETGHPHDRMPPIFIDPKTGKPEVKESK